MFSSWVELVEIDQIAHSDSVPSSTCGVSYPTTLGYHRCDHFIIQRAGSVVVVTLTAHLLIVVDSSVGSTRETEDAKCYNINFDGTLDIKRLGYIEFFDVLGICSM